MPHLGVEPSYRVLEGRCLFRLAYEAMSDDCMFRNKKKAPRISEPLERCLCWRRLGVSARLFRGPGFPFD